MDKRLFVVGATGFIGAEVVRQALAEGWTVSALVRSPDRGAKLPPGVRQVAGAAEAPGEWIAAAAGHAVLLDLVQPALPRRLTVASMP